MNHVKMFKVQPRRFALWVLVPHWYKTFSPDHIDLAVMQTPIELSNKTSIAQSCAQDQILDNKILRTRFAATHYFTL